MEAILLVITTAVSGINLAFILKLIFNDIHELRGDIKAHLNWHLNGSAEQRKERKGT